MYEKNFHVAIAMTVHQDARADFCHALGSRHKLKRKIDDNLAVRHDEIEGPAVPV
jgi:hypothetical protein